MTNAKEWLDKAVAFEASASDDNGQKKAALAFKQAMNADDKEHAENPRTASLPRK